MGRARGILVVGLHLLLTLAVALGGPSVSEAQDRTFAAPAAGPPDFAGWDLIARRAETLLDEPGLLTEALLGSLREEVVGWRARFLVAQGAEVQRIEALRSQIAALGTPPADAAAEAPEIAARRAELGSQLARIEAPVLAADEAWRRADAIVMAIDRVLRERQARALLTIGPAPANPENWPAVIPLVRATLGAVIDEVAAAAQPDLPRSKFVGNLPAIVGLLGLAVLLVWSGRRWLRLLQGRIDLLAPKTLAPLSHAIVSVGQVGLPTAGAWLISRALVLGGLDTGVSGALAAALPEAGFAVAFAQWLGERLFGAAGRRPILPRDNEAANAAARRIAGLLGVVFAIGLLLNLGLAALPEAPWRAAGNAVVLWPLAALAGVLLWRAGRLLGSVHDPAPAPPDAGSGQTPTVAIDRRIRHGLAAAARAIGIIAPLLALAGYSGASDALLRPAILSLAVGGGVLVLHRLAVRLIVLVRDGTGTGPTAPETGGLSEVLAGIALSLAALPVLALVWGARTTDLAEILARFQTGVRLGDARIAPDDIIAFAVVFIAGYALTRAIKTTLRTTVLPRTSLDRGGQTAIVSGVGYAGYTLAALIAISAAGLDLSSLAIVAGALSVGIGFGLQNIVSNFVAGIILLIERPVSEGDWIEVGGVQGIVRAISVRSTRIETFDRTDVIVPNADLISNQVTNWTHFNQSGRLIVPVGVAYGTDTRRVADVLVEIARATPGLLAQPAPTAVFAGFGPSSLDFELRVFLRDVNTSVVTRSEINHAIAHRFAQAGIDIPFPQREVWLRPAAGPNPTSPEART